MATYVKVANVDDLQPGQAKFVSAGDQQVELFNVDGICYAISDTCTHRGGPLSEGTLENDVVTCPWHGARFCVTDGQVQGHRLNRTSRRTLCESRTAVSKSSTESASTVLKKLKARVPTP